jgi:hypothetical protein
MFINITNKNIVKALYGKTNLLDVTDKILETINTMVHVNNDFFGNDPCYGVVKYLYIMFDDMSHIMIEEGESIRLVNETMKVDKSKLSTNDSKFGFIIIRHVMNKESNSFWLNCYKSIRIFYDNLIVIIDDNSNKDFITKEKLENVVIIDSEFPKRGELLPYYYYYHNKFFDRAVVFHDNIIVKKYFDYENIKQYNMYSRLLEFNNHAYRVDIKYFEEFCNTIEKGNDILEYHKTNINKLFGCFGVMYVIDHDFLVNVEEEYKVLNLINVVDNRDKRKTLERFLSTVFMKYAEENDIKTKLSLFGSYHLAQQNKNEYLYKKNYGR